MSERILAFGGYATGKSTLYMSLMEELDATFYILDTDYAIERNVPVHLDKKVKFVQGDSFRDLMRLTNIEFKPDPGPNDFIIVDMSESIWIMIQRMVGVEKYGFQVDSLGMAKEPNPFKERMAYWSDCSKLLRSFWINLIKQPCHLIAVTGESPLNVSGAMADDEQTISFYSQVGVKASGGRKDGHYFHTVFHMSRSGKDYRITTLRDKFTMQEELDQHRPKFLRTDITGQRFYDFYWDKYVIAH